MLKVPATIDEDEFKSFIRLSIASSDECPLYFMGIPCQDKIARTAVHKLFKDNPHLSKHIDSDTQTVDAVQFVRLIAKHKRKEHNVPIVYVSIHIYH